MANSREKRLRALIVGSVGAASITGFAMLAQRESTERKTALESAAKVTLAAPSPETPSPPVAPAPTAGVPNPPLASAAKPSGRQRPIGDIDSRDPETAAPPLRNVDYLSTSLNQEVVWSTAGDGADAQHAAVGATDGDTPQQMRAFVDPVLGAEGPVILIPAEPGALFDPKGIGPEQRAALEAVEPPVPTAEDLEIPLAETEAFMPSPEEIQEMRREAARGPTPEHRAYLLSLEAQAKPTREDLERLERLQAREAEIEALLR